MKDKDQKIVHGHVIWFRPDIQYGFVVREDQEARQGKDRYFHFTDLVMDGYKTVLSGQGVSYIEGYSERGATAYRVTPNDRPRRIFPRAGKRQTAKTQLRKEATA